MAADKLPVRKYRMCDIDAPLVEGGDDPIHSSAR